MDDIIFCKGGGCTAKLGAGVLSRVLEMLPKAPYDKNLGGTFSLSSDLVVSSFLPAVVYFAVALP